VSNSTTFIQPLCRSFLGCRIWIKQENSSKEANILNDSRNTSGSTEMKRQVLCVSILDTEIILGEFIITCKAVAKYWIGELLTCRHMLVIIALFFRSFVPYEAPKIHFPFQHAVGGFWYDLIFRGS
jgi:hypothetical protein